MSDRSKRPTLRQTPDPDAATSVWDGAPKPPLRAISKKTPGVAAPSDAPPRAVPQVKLRAIAEVKGGPISPQALGYLAPPRDPSETRARRRRDLIVWGSISVIIACAVALGIWFVAR
jgi:hypothetical protein